MTENTVKAVEYACLATHDYELLTKIFALGYISSLQKCQLCYDLGLVKDKEEFYKRFFNYRVKNS